MQLVTAILLGLEGLLSLSTCYLLALLGAAAYGRRARPSHANAAEHLRFTVLIPAHDEESGIEGTLASLEALDYPTDRLEVVVIADNCRDRTAAVARTAGATVYERTDPDRRGKGHALAWALERLRAEQSDGDVIVFLDADCQVSPNLLAAMEARLRAGAEAVQADYVVANPGESWSSGLRYAAFALINTVRPLGKGTLGLSCGLLGTGMGFKRTLLEREPWEAYSLAEDGEYHLRLVASGARVAFAREASVSSAMPTSLRGAREQQLRWEGGRWELIRSWTPKLLRSGLRHRDPVRLHAALEPVVPPQSLLLAGNAALAVAALVLRSPVGLTLAGANLAGQGAYILGGLALVRAPARVYRALALAPVLMLWKVGLYVRILGGRGSKGWVRTERETPTASSGEARVSAK